VIQPPRDDSVRRARDAQRAVGSGCYTPALTARTERSSVRTGPKRARDGASRAGHWV